MGEDSAVACYAAEFVGTFMLIFTIGCNVLSGQPIWGGVSIACGLTVTIYALGKSSGANFNPAVSLALGLCNKLAWLEVAIYMGVQLVAGILAGIYIESCEVDSLCTIMADGGISKCVHM